MGESINNISPKNLMALRDTGENFALVDVRKLPAFESSGQIIPGALWRDHEQVEIWSAAYVGDAQLIVYCVHGHEVSQNATAKLLLMGIDARYLQGGFDAWIEAGGNSIEVSQNGR